MDKIITYYRDRLGIDLENIQHPISKLVDIALRVSGLEQIVVKQRLRMIGLSLMEIRDYDASLYEFYLKRIVNNADLSVNGFFFEVIQCSNLIKTAQQEKINFKFGDHSLDEPDFFLDDCGFELTMIRFTDESNKRNADQKLLKKFREKNKKKYANKDTLLLIEITQVVHYANQHEFKPNIGFNDLLKIISSESKFGVVLCYIENTDVTPETIHFKGTVHPAYGKECSQKLRDIILKITKGKKNEFYDHPYNSPF